jgi:hypothetical protein
MTTRWPAGLQPSSYGSPLQPVAAALAVAAAAVAVALRQPPWPLVAILVLQVAHVCLLLRLLLQSLDGAAVAGLEPGACAEGTSRSG